MMRSRSNFFSSFLLLAYVYSHFVTTIIVLLCHSILHIRFSSQVQIGKRIENAHDHKMESGWCHFDAILTNFHIFSHRKERKLYPRISSEKVLSSSLPCNNNRIQFIKYASLWCLCLIQFISQCKYCRCRKIRTSKDNIYGNGNEFVVTVFVVAMVTT